MKKADKLFKQLINENYIDLKPITPIEATPKTDFENKFAEYLAEEAKVVEKKPSKEVEEIESHNYDYKDPKNLDNQIGQEVLNGIYFEAKQNPDKTLDEIREIVSKNLAKDGQYYMKNAAFGIEGLGYTEQKTEEVSGKHAASGYSDKVKEVVKESLMSDVAEGYGAREYEQGKEAGEKIEKKKLSKKAKKESIDTDLAEIDKQAQIVALEAKLNKMDEVIENKMTRINMVSEDENLAELMDKKKLKAMQKEVKVLEKRKAKMEKMYEKMCGKKYKREEIVDEVEDLFESEFFPINEGYGPGGKSTFGGAEAVWQVPSDTEDMNLKPYAGKLVMAVGGGGNKENDPDQIYVTQITPVEKDAKRGYKSLPTISLKGDKPKYGEAIDSSGKTPGYSVLSKFGKVIGYLKPDKSDPDYEAKRNIYSRAGGDDHPLGTYAERRKLISQARQSGDFSKLTFKKKDGQTGNLEDEPIKYKIDSDPKY